MSAFQNTLQLDQFSAWVTIEGLQREIYVSSDGRCITCWIASELGKKFSVNWRNNSMDIDIEADVGLDGVVHNQHVMLDAFNFQNKPDGFEVCYSKAFDYMCRDFLFPATDDNAHLYTPGNTPHFGTIQLEVWRLRANDVAFQSPEHQHNSPVLANQKLHELSNMDDHPVIFGREYLTRSPVDLVDNYKMDASPYATFIFKYGSLDMLMTNGIVTRPAGQHRAAPVTQDDYIAAPEKRQTWPKKREGSMKIHGTWRRDGGSRADTEPINSNGSVTRVNLT